MVDGAPLLRALPALEGMENAVDGVDSALRQGTPSRPRPPPPEDPQLELERPPSPGGCLLKATFLSDPDRTQNPGSGEA